MFTFLLLLTRPRSISLYIFTFLLLLTSQVRLSIYIYFPAPAHASQTSCLNLAGSTAVVAAGGPVVARGPGSGPVTFLEFKRRDSVESQVSAI